MADIALLYEHPTWSNALVARMRERRVSVALVDVGDMPSEPHEPLAHRLWVNRVNAMPSGSRPPSVAAATGHLLLSLELGGAQIVNGSRCHQIGASKVAQASLFEASGLLTPRSVAINEAPSALRAAEAIGFPVLTKPNVGGSGSGIVRHETSADLEASIARHEVDLGIDGTGLVQQLITSSDHTVHRVELLGGELLYATDQSIQNGVYNYCAADGCAVDAGPASIRIVEPATEIVSAARQILSAADCQVGGVEYLLDATTGEPCFYDFNPYSNFVSGQDEVLGFNPIDRYIDFVLAQL